MDKTARRQYLLDITKGNDAFLRDPPALQHAWDTVSTGALKECPRFYQLSVLEGWTPKSLNIHIYFGLLAHSALERYDIARAKGQTHDESTRVAVRYCLEKTGTRRDIFLCSDCGSTNEIIENEPNIICRGCNSEKISRVERFFPWESYDSNKNRKNLVRTIVWYLEHYKNDSSETVIFSDGKPAVECWFRFKLPRKTPAGENYILLGHIDKLVHFNGAVWFRDLKTSKNTISSDYFEQFSIDNQMSFYTAGGKIALHEPVVGGIIDAAQIAVNFSRFQRGFIERTPGQVDEWIEDIQYWIKQAEGFAEDLYWPMNDKACGHYGGCQFRGVCNKDASSRKNYLRKTFVQRQWNPLKKREF